MKRLAGVWRKSWVGFGCEETQATGFVAGNIRRTRMRGGFCSPPFASDQSSARWVFPLTVSPLRPLDKLGHLPGDRLQIETKVVKATMARIEHAYRVVVNGNLIAEGTSTIACVDREGNIRRMPEHIIGE